jgi:hypothetical protein
MTDLRKQLDLFRGRLENAHRTRRMVRLERMRGYEEQANASVLPGLTLSPDIAALLADLKAAVARDSRRYQSAAPEAAAAAAPPLSPFVQGLRVGLAPHLRRVESPDVPADLPAPVRFFASLLAEELGHLTGEAALLGSAGAAVVPRLKQAQKALYAQRHTDALTILRTALHADPHNYLLLYLLSQYLYLLHHLNQQGALPEARELAQKSILMSEKVPPERLMHYRYHATVTELGVEPARALGWLRDTGLLKPAAMLTPGNWLGGQAVPLRAWLMLAQLPVALWQEAEFTALHELARDGIGGGLLYAALFRQPLTAEAATRKEPLPMVHEIERMLQLSWLLYNDIAVPLTELGRRPQEAEWTVRARFMHIVARLGPLPAFDQLLLQIALNGRDVRTGYPDQELRLQLDDPHAGYWRLWAGALSPQRETRLSHLLPAADTFEDLELFPLAEELTAAFRAKEQSLLKPELWNDLQPWLPPWQLEHLLAAGTGSNRPRLRFAPNLPPYSAYYRRWSEPSPRHVLPSDIIAENARRGAFASLFEVLAAFEGALRLITDPAHGLVAAQKRALAAAKKANPAKFGASHLDFGGAGPAAKAIILGLLLIGGIAAAVMLTGNAGQAIGLSLVVAGVVGMLAVQFAKTA